MNIIKCLTGRECEAIFQTENSSAYFHNINSLRARYVCGVCVFFVLSYVRIILIWIHYNGAQFTLNWSNSVLTVYNTMMKHKYQRLMASNWLCVYVAVVEKDRKWK